MIPSRRTPRPCPWLTCALGRCARAAFPAEGGENWSPPSPRSGAPVGTRETWRMHPCGRLAHLPTAGRPGFQARPPWLHQPSIARVRQVSSRAVLILADGAGTKGAAVHLLVPWFPHALVRSSPPVPARERKKKKKKNILLSDTSIFPNSPLIKPSAGGSGTFFFFFCFVSSFPFPPPPLSLSPLPFLGRQSATVRTISGPITFFFAFPFHIASTVFLPQRHRIHPFAQRFFRRRRSAPASCGRGYDRRADCSTAAR